MAKVEMDLSEFKRMEQVEKDLRDSLDREKELGQKLEQAKEEKIEALEKADKSVTIITEKRVYEHLIQNRSDTEIKHYLQRWFFEFLARNSTNRGGSHFFNPDRVHDWEIDLDFLKSRLSDALHCDRDINGSYMSEIFFTKNSSVTSPSLESVENKTVIRKGLDEYLVTLREELQDEVDEDVKRQLDDIPSFKIQVKEEKAKTKEAVKEKNELILDLNAANKYTEELEKQSKHLRGELKKSQKRFEQFDGLEAVDPDIISKTKEILSRTGFMKKSGMINELRGLWNQQDG